MRTETLNCLPPEILDAFSRGELIVRTADDELHGLSLMEGGAVLRRLSDGAEFAVQGNVCAMCGPGCQHVVAVRHGSRWRVEP